MITSAEREFLRKHNIDESLVFDSGGISKNKYQEICKNEGYLFVAGASPCRRGGHTLRTKNGHCIVCNPANITFARRAYSSGYVYVLYSESQRISKVGFTNHLPDRRLRHLNTIRYGGITDWKLLDFLKSDHAGRIEILFHRELKAYRHSLTYEREGNFVQSREIYRLKPDIIKEVFNVFRSDLTLSADLHQICHLIQNILGEYQARVIEQNTRAAQEFFEQRRRSEQEQLDADRRRREQARIIEQNRRVERERLSADLASVHRSRYPFLRGFELDFYKKRLDNKRKAKANSVRTPFGTFTSYVRNNSSLTSELKRIKSLDKEQIQLLENAKKHSERKNAFSRYFLVKALVFLVIGVCVGYYPPLLLVTGVAFVLYLSLLFILG